MYFKKIQIFNYKSIKNSDMLEINENINVFCGKNDSGKTATLKAIYEKLQNYRGLANNLIYNSKFESGLCLGFVASNDEIEKIYKTVELVSKPKLEKNMYFLLDFRYIENKIVEIYFDIRFKNNFKEKIDLISYQVNSYKIFDFDKKVMVDKFSKNEFEKFLSILLEYIYKSIFYIDVNRIPLTGLNLSNEVELNSNCSNLYNVLFTIHNNNETLYDKIIENFKRIFSNIKNVYTQFNTSNCEIIVEYKDSRKVLLRECGTGLTQVLIMVVLYYTKKQTIILFDEPHSFLHPYAEKEIYKLADKSNHQYLFSTHSPVLINFLCNKNVFLLHKEDEGFTNYNQIDKDTEIKRIYDEIGLSSSDLAFSDKLIFVEGETEKIVLSKILACKDIKEYDYRIITIEQTGRDFIKETSMNHNLEKHTKILNNISKFPIEFIFVIDKDEKNEEKISKIKEIYGEHIIVLKRREIENYFIDIEAIEYVLNKHYEKRENIKKLIDDIFQNRDKTFFKKEPSNLLNDVKGSAIIEYLFKEHGIEPYNKITNAEYFIDYFIQKGNSTHFLSLINELVDIISWFSP